MRLPGLKKVLFAAMFAALLAGPVKQLLAKESTSEKVAATAKPEGGESKGVEEEEDETASFKHSASVKKIGSLLGLSTEQAATVFEVANFAVLAVLVGLFLAKALPKTFRGRSATIQKDLVDARSATEEANNRLSGVEARLAKLDGEIAAMKAQADRDSVLDEQRIKANVEEEKKKILASAEQEIAAATIQAQRQIQKYAAELAIEQAAKKLVITAETDRLLIQNFARRVGADDSKEGQN